MTDMSYFVLDIVENATNAHARNIAVVIREDTAADELVLAVVDDGDGMDESVVRRAPDPFFTTRTTRRLGLGLPLLKAAAELAEGTFAIESAPGAGTSVEARFRRSHLDTPPLGDLAETIFTICLNRDIEEFHYAHLHDGRRFDFSLGELRTILDGVPVTAPEIGAAIKTFLSRQISMTRGDYHEIVG